MTDRGRSRRLQGAAAVIIASLTAVAGTLLGATGGFAFGGVAMVTLTVFALPYPFLITGQVTAGSALAAALLLSEATAPITVLPLVAGIVATAELLALATGQNTPQRRAHGDELSRAMGAVLVAAGMFGAVLWLGGLPGPTGLLAIALASGACIMLSFVLIGRSSSEHPQFPTRRHTERR